VVQLLQYRRSVRVYRVGDFTEMRDYRVVAVAEVAARQHCGGVHRHRFDHDHRRAADSAFFVVTAMAFPGESEIGHVGGMGAKHDAVVEFSVTQFERLENVLVLAHGYTLKSDRS
jgi:hypothetical protein